MNSKKDEKWYKIFSKKDMENYPNKKISTQIIEKNKAIALVKDGEEFYAIDNSCAHQGGPLGEGTLKTIDGKNYIVCPWHGYEYDFEGKAPPGYKDCVNNYKTEIREDGLYISLPQLPDQDRVSDQIVNVLITWGIKTVFGMIGHSNLAMGEALRKRKSEITFIGVRHEGAASFAASAYGKLTGEPGVCLTIAGPGATNLLTGLYDAKLDRSPVLALTGQINTQFLGPGAFQEVDLMSAFADVTVWQQLVLSPENASELTALAIKHALLERNVTQLALPDEVQKMPGEIKNIPKYGRIPTSLKILPDPVEYDKTKKLILKSNYLTIIVGYGARNYRKEIEELAEKLQCAVVTTFKAKGTISDNHPLGCGVLGSSGTPIGSSEVSDADVLLVLGSSFSEKTSIPTNKKIIQVDIDPLILGKRKPVTLPILADISSFIKKLTEDFPNHETNLKRIKKIELLKENWRIEKKNRSKETKNGLHPALVFSILAENIPDDAVITVDVGNNAYSFGRYFESKQQEIVLSGYLGSIGFAFPAALGASLARPDKRIFAIAGDGGFGQYLGEFLTAVHYKLPIILILLNNNQLGKISNEQLFENFPIFATKLTNPDFSKFAELCGGVGFTITTPEELKNALQESLRVNKPSIIEILSDPLAT